MNTEASNNDDRRGRRTAALAGRQVFTLRPADDSRALLRRLRASGAEARNLPVLRLYGEPASERLAIALKRMRADDRWLFSSPVAVRHAARIDAELGGRLFGSGAILAPAARAGRVFAPGPGTARALARLGVSGARSPIERFDSEGVLALSELAAPLSGALHLVAAPGGRGLLARTLAERGARVEPVWVYRRESVSLPARLHAALEAATRPLLLASSQAALHALIADLHPDLLRRLRAHAGLVVASPRLAEQAQQLGFECVRVAASARPEALVAAAIELPGA